MVGDNDNETLKRRLDIQTDTIHNILMAIKKQQEEIDAQLRKMYNTIAFLCAVVFGFIVTVLFITGN